MTAEITTIINASEILANMPVKVKGVMQNYVEHMRGSAMSRLVGHTAKKNENRAMKYVHAVFSMVADKSYWKNPFVVIIHGSMEDRKIAANMVKYAAEFHFGGSGHRIEHYPNSTIVTSPGYQCW